MDDLARRRSSLKHKIVIPEHLLEEYSKPKTLKWDVQDDEGVKKKETHAKFKEADIHYQEVVNCY
jgi:hypothetical protein